jgi:sec-independent protein translocase protein TatA
MGNFGWSEILLIAFVVLLLFGGKKIPELMRGLGKGVREFNDAKNKVRSEIEDSVVDKETETRTTTTTSSSATQS